MFILYPNLSTKNIYSFNEVPISENFLVYTKLLDISYIDNIAGSILSWQHPTLLWIIIYAIFTLASPSLYVIDGVGSAGSEW